MFFFSFSYCLSLSLYSLLMLAGTDTTSMGLSQIMELLAQNLGMLEKLRAEIKEAQQRHGDNIPYDILVDLPYLDAVCRESLRLYA